MKEQEIVENNKLIAEFMGAVVWDDPREGVWYKGFADYSHPVHEEALGYHWSWDWLMPVVQKIHSDTDVFVTIGYNYCKIHHCKSWVMDEIRIEDKLPIECVYLAIVQFLTWYNQQPK